MFKSGINVTLFFFWQRLTWKWKNNVTYSDNQRPLMQTTLCCVFCFFSCHKYQDSLQILRTVKLSRIFSHVNMGADLVGNILKYYPRVNDFFTCTSFWIPTSELIKLLKSLVDLFGSSFHSNLNLTFTFLSRCCVGVLSL